AVRDGLRAAGGVEATLKWPNDVLVDGRKTAGILVEMTTVPAGGDFSVRLPALVVGVGINVSLTEDELPVPHATSLSLAGGVTDRDAVATAVLEALAVRHTQWRACERGSGSSVSDALLAEYSQACSTLGSDVRVELPGDVVRSGRAARVDRQGRLVVVDTGQGRDDSGGGGVAGAAGGGSPLRGGGARGQAGAPRRRRHRAGPGRLRRWGVGGGGGGRHPPARRRRWAGRLNRGLRPFGGRPRGGADRPQSPALARARAPRPGRRGGRG